MLKSSFILVKKTVMSTKSDNYAPDSLRIIPTFLKTEWHSSLKFFGMLLSDDFLDPIPDKNKKSPTFLEWGYAPTGFGALLILKFLPTN